MNPLRIHHETTLQYDLIQKFEYSRSKPIFTLKQAVLSATTVNPSIDYFTALSLFTQIFVGYKGNVTLSTSNRLRLNLRIHKGDPVGYKITLRRKELFVLLEKLVGTTRTVNTNKIFSSKKCTSTYSFKVTELLRLSQLESQYKYIKNIQDMHISVLANSVEPNALKYFLKLI